MNKVIFSIFALFSIREVDGQNKQLSAAKIFFDEQIDLKSMKSTYYMLNRFLNELCKV